MKHVSRRVLIATYFLVLSSVLQITWCADFSMTIESARQTIDAILQDETVVGLSVALVSDNDIVWQEGFGFADREEQIPATVDTVYAIGSVSKTFTAISVLQQVEQGRIDLDRPVSDYLPEFSLLHRYGNSQDEQNSAITVRRLLNHHSGIPGDLLGGIFLTGPAYYSQYISWLLNYLSTTYPSQEPGSIASYCNTGFVLAGEIARRAGAQAGEDDFGDYLERTVLKPLGMNHSYTHVIGKEVPHLAMGYIGGDSVMPFEFNGVATGGIYSTVPDMSLFLKMLLNEGVEPTSGSRLLTAASVKEMGRIELGSFDLTTFFRPGLGLDCAHMYRYTDAIPSLEESGLTYGRAWLKDGSTNNFSSIINLLPDQKLGVVLLFNSDGGETYKYPLAEQILLDALRDKLAMEVAKPSLPDYSEFEITDPALVTGVYVSSGQPIEIVAGDNGSLLLISNPGTEEENTMTLIPSGGSHFAGEGIVGYYSFLSVNHRILLMKSGGTIDTLSELMVRIVGEKIEPVETPQAWRDRVGVYVMDDIPPFDAVWMIADQPIVELSLLNDNYLMFDVLALPHNDSLAFLPGLTSRQDSRIEIDKSGGVTYGGYHMIPLESIPLMTLGEEYSIEVQYSHGFPKTLWHTFEINPDQADSWIYWKTGDSNTEMRFYDESFKLSAGGSGYFALILEPGTYYLGVSPGFDSPAYEVFSSSFNPLSSHVEHWDLY